MSGQNQPHSPCVFKSEMKSELEYTPPARHNLRSTTGRSRTRLSRRCVLNTKSKGKRPVTTRQFRAPTSKQTEQSLVRTFLNIKIREPSPDSISNQSSSTTSCTSIRSVESTNAYVNISDSKIICKKYPQWYSNQSIRRRPKTAVKKLHVVEPSCNFLTVPSKPSPLPPITPGTEVPTISSTHIVTKDKLNRSYTDLSYKNNHIKLYEAEDHMTSFSDWNSKVADFTLTYNGGKPVQFPNVVSTFFTECPLTKKIRKYQTCLLFQSGGFGDILLALKSNITRVDARSDHPAGIGSIITSDMSDELKTAFKISTSCSRTQTDPKLVVVKMPKSRLTDNAADKAFRKAKRVYDTIKAVQNPYICTMQDFSNELRTEIYKYYPCDLARMAKDIQKRYLSYQVIPENFLFFWTVQLAEAITFLHENGIIHCDIHPENVLVDAEGFLLLHDFGLSKKITALSSESKSMRFSGRIRQNAWIKIPKKFRDDYKQFALLEAGWWPPELEDAFRGGSFRSMNHTVDWYGLGATLFRLRTGSYPLRQYGENQQLKMLERSGFLQRTDKDNHLSPHFTNMILQFLRERITDRLGMMGDGREVFSHASFRNSFVFKGCDDWLQRRERVQQRQIPLPYRLRWGWSDLTLRQESQLPSLT